MADTPEVALSEHVSKTLNEWLVEEIVNSDEGRNAYLSDYQDRRNDVFKPFDDTSNYLSQKAKSHYDRLKEWATPYKESDFRVNDWFAARLTYACLMEISGSYGKQCFFEAADESDYLSRRHEHPSGIDIEEEVSKEVHYGKLSTVAAMSDDERLDYIIGRSLRANDENLNLHKLLHIWAAGREKSPGNIATALDAPVVAMKEAQKLWTGLVAAHIVVAASFRGDDYSSVPFLEPKSITDVSEIIYPLAI